MQKLGQHFFILAGEGAVDPGPCEILSLSRGPLSSCSLKVRRCFPDSTFVSSFLKISR